MENQGWFKLPLKTEFWTLRVKLVWSEGLCSLRLLKLVCSFRNGVVPESGGAAITLLAGVTSGDDWLAFCLPGGFECSFGWSECNFCSKIDHEETSIAPLISLRDISTFFFILLHTHLWLLSYFSKWNYPARLNHGKEIIKILSCQQSESSQHILGGLNVGYSFTLFCLLPCPTPTNF